MQFPHCQNFMKAEIASRNGVMKWLHSFQVRMAKLMVIALVALMNVGNPLPLSAAPPPEEESHGLEKVGDFFFRLARRLERGSGRDDDEDTGRRSDPRRQDSRAKSGPSTGLVLPQGYQRGDEDRSGSAKREAPTVRRTVPTPVAPRVEPFTPPKFQPNPQPYRLYPETASDNATKPNATPPQTTATLETDSARRHIAPAEITTPLDPPARPQKEARVDASPASQPVPSSKASLPFGTPVPGSRGFVYPPGAKHEPGNMLDVREVSSGQQVRDPRSGQMFLVPPK